MDEQTRTTIEAIYGFLWSCNIDTRTRDGAAIFKARRLALGLIDKDGQSRGITAARDQLKEHPQCSTCPI